MIIPSCTGNQQTILTQTSMPTLTAAIEPTATITPTPLPSYDLCPDIENFREAYIPVEELLDGSYFRWLKDVVAPTLLPWFQAHEDKIRTDVSISPIALEAGNAFIFNAATVPNFEDPETAPFKRDVTFGYTTIERSGDSDLLYIIFPVFYYDMDNQQVDPILTVTPAYLATEEAIALASDIYINDMNMTPIIVDDIYYGKKDPIVRRAFANVGSERMDASLEDFYTNVNFSALSNEDMIFLTTISATDWFK